MSAKFQLLLLTMLEKDDNIFLGESYEYCRFK